MTDQESKTNAEATKIAFGLVALGVGLWFLVMGVVPRHIVDRGPGGLSDPSEYCSTNSKGNRTCNYDVRLTFYRTDQTVTVDNQDLYNTVTDDPNGGPYVDRIYYDTTFGRVDKLDFGHSELTVESSPTFDLVFGIIGTTVGVPLLAWFAYPRYRARRAERRSRPSPGPL